MLDESVLGIGWKALGDLSGIDWGDALETLYRKAHPETKDVLVLTTLANSGRLWSLRNRRDGRVPAEKRVRDGGYVLFLNILNFDI